MDKQEEEGDFITLGAFTTPDLANKRAGQAVLAFRPERRSGMPERERIRWREKEGNMWRFLNKLDEEDKLFDQEVMTDDGGTGRVWVAELGVEGPRN